MPLDEPLGRPATRHGPRLNQFCSRPAAAVAPGPVADRRLAADACAARYHQPRRECRSPRRRGRGRGPPGRSALPARRIAKRAIGRAHRAAAARARYPCRGDRPCAPGGCPPGAVSVPRESAVRTGRLLPYPCRRESAMRAWWPRAERQVIAGIVRRLIMDCSAALDPAGDDPVTAAGGQHLPRRTAVTRLPGDNNPAWSPRVAGLASGRVSPPARQPRFVHS